MNPPFLQPWSTQPSASTHTEHVRTTFNHSGVLEDEIAEVLYWPPSETEAALPRQQVTDTVLLFLPGNPGLVDFYILFLSAIQRRCRALPQHQKAFRLSLVAKAHLGHSPTLFRSGNAKHGTTKTDLSSQVESTIQIYDALRKHFVSSPSGIIIIGHSVGAWIALQAGGRYAVELLADLSFLGLQVIKARPDVDALFMLCPTISNIGGTPNGRRLKVSGPFLRVVRRLPNTSPHLSLVAI
jgi:pimeloyl-ACP methyl ester carboxylesterase